MSDQLAIAEREKYVRMWARPEYRRWSPGEDSAKQAVAVFGRGVTVTDFGCGESRAVDVLRGAGLDTIGTDHVALRSDVVEGSLWDLPASLRVSDWGFCADVMEHIPTERVSDVLAGIAARVRRGCYFRIDLGPDSMGRLIGETLHLTVRSRGWWVNEITRHFSRCRSEQTESHRSFVAVAEHPRSTR